MMTTVKKNYASLQAVQEGNLVPEDKQLDVKGIETLTKSSKSESTREALKKILLEDIMRAPVIDQLKFVKDMAIFEKTIVNSVQSGSKQYFKPSVVKAMNVYADPLRQQNVRACLVWNAMHPSGTPSINLEERNAVDLAKVQINYATIANIKDSYPEVYENCLKLLEMPEFKDKDVIDCIAIPLDVPTPDWLMPFIDYHEIVSSNISGYPYESIGIKRMEKQTVNWTNIVQL